MPRPDCPRCGSDLVVAAPSGTPSEWVLELRGGDTPVSPVGGGFVHWLCHSCGYRWDPAAYPDRWIPGPGDPLPDPDDILTQLGLEVAPSADAATTEERDTNPGAVLRRAREERGRTLSEASKGTRIWEHHLEALESGAPLEEFPAPAYARFFLREYAEFLQLDPAPLLREFDERHPAVEEPPLEPLPDNRGRRRALAGIMAALAVAALIVIALLPPGSRPSVEPLPLARAAPVDVHDSGHLASKPEPHGVRAVLRLSEPCWVRAIADGEVLASTTFPPGKRLVYRDRHLLELTLGNAGGVALRVNGDPVATGSSAVVVSFEFRWHKGRVVITRI